MTRLATVAMVCACARAESSSGWTLVQSKHFDIYSQAGEVSARSALMWFEQLRAIFQQAGLDLDGRPAVRVIGFRSTKEYDRYRLRPTSDAYYVGTESRDYIVMPTLEPDRFGIAAHEYAHLILHVAGEHLPPWLAEGLAEFFSTIRIGATGCQIGSDLPIHSQTLRSRSWIPLKELLALPEDSPLRERREDAELFYAESWNLVEMLVLSPQYSRGFSDLLRSLASHPSSAEALTTVYGKSLETIARDAGAWRNRGNSKPLSLPAVPTGQITMAVSQLSPFASRSLLAELLLAAGELDRAEALYRDLAREAPDDANVSAAVGTIALRRGDRESARREWKRALKQGVDDPLLCYRYALLAEEAGFGAEDIRHALEATVALNPDFDDARYKLALLESNAGHYEAAVMDLEAMRSVAASRAYAYWSAMAYALEELGRREEAKAAAQKASRHAITAEERAHAAQLAYTAQTDMAVQFTRDGEGRTQLVTTRVPHGTADWNPFIEPGDHIRRAEGQLRRIECEGNTVTGVAVEAGKETFHLSIPDPLHVLMRNAPVQFTCGEQAETSVTVEFAASDMPGSSVDGILRGMQFR